MTKASGAVFDVAIVGYGPAGITAAIYAARKRLSTLLIGELAGGEVVTSGEIANWPGDGVTDGIALAQKMTDHLKLYKEALTIVQDSVHTITKDNDGYFTLTAGVSSWRSTTVIYATGRHPRLLNVPGEKEFKNRGVTYCATCDAPLFQGKEVAVIGGGNTGAEAVIMLQKIATKIHLLHLDEALKADAVLVDNFKNDPKVVVHLKAKTAAIGGEAMVTSLRFDNLTSGQAETLEVQGVFVAIGAIPNTEPIKDLLPLTPLGAVAADRYGVTSLPGFFAAGDVTDIRDAQIVVAAGHGCSAALSAGDYLARHTVA